MYMFTSTSTLHFPSTVGKSPVGTYKIRSSSVENDPATILSSTNFELTLRGTEENGELRHLYKLETPVCSMQLCSYVPVGFLSASSCACLSKEGALSLPYAFTIVFEQGNETHTERPAHRHTYIIVIQIVGAFALQLTIESDSSEPVVLDELEFYNLPSDAYQGVGGKCC